MSRLLKRKVKAIGYYISSWILWTLGLSLLMVYGFHEVMDLKNTVFMLQLSLFLGLSHGIYDVVVLQDEMDHRPAWMAMLIRSCFFLASICLYMGLCVMLWGQHNAEDSMINENSIVLLKVVFAMPRIQASIVILFFLGHLITFIRSVHKKFGSRVFVNTILGKYQDPVEEDRIFMFVDLRHSTTIAEELGHKTYSSFMRDYYKLLSNCCEENRGEIYQIAGDGAFLTWKIKSCLHKARPLDCFYDFVECLRRTRPRFMKKYGIAPQFKAGAHCGKVISTEVGNFGSEMAYHGDVLNTTSRIQDMCSRMGQEFLISEKLLYLLPLPLPHGFMAKKEGFFELKGKKSEILIFSLHLPLTDD